MRVAKILPALAVCVALAGGAARAEPVKIRIAWVVPIGNWASIIYEKKDIMPHYGKSYVVEPTHFQATPLMITAMGAGELEIADFAYSTFSLSVENAGMKDLRIIADESQDGVNGYNSGAYYVLKDGPIHAIEDLRGKVLATVAAGSAIDIPVRALLRKHGLETPRDYTVVETGFPNMTAMLLAKKADFVPNVPPFSLDPRLTDNARVLFRVDDALGGGTEFIIWAARAEFLQKNRAAMVDLMEDAIRVVHYLMDPKNHAEVVQIAAKITGQQASTLNWVFSKVDAYHDPNMIPNLVTFQKAIDVQQSVGLLKAPLAAKDYADLSIVKEAAARIK